MILLGFTKIFPESKVQIAVTIQSKAAKPIMRVVTFRNEVGDWLACLGHIIAITIADAKHLITLGNIDPVVVPTPNTHRGVKIAIESAKAIRPTIAIGILNELQPIVLGPTVILWRKMSV